MTGGLTLTTPWALGLCVLAAVPMAVWAALERRQARVRAVLGLSRSGSASSRWTVGLAVLACVALAAAAAQPVSTRKVTRDARSRSEVVFVVDVSRSMLASSAHGASTRLEKARRAAVTLRGAVPDVPAGVAGLTDRVLPYLFPSLDRSAFSRTVGSSVAADSPPPERVATVATSFAGLAALRSDGFYSRGARFRTCVLLTDGETRAGAGEPSGSVASALAGRHGCTLIVVGVGGATDRIRDARGRVDPAYRPEASAGATLRRLADDAGGTLASVESLPAAARALRAAAEVGPTRAVGVRTTHRSFSFALAALGAAAALASIATSGAFSPLRRRQTHYHLTQPRSHG